ncbi:NAD(P)-dependent oxidoreductase [uncultured Sphaerochaeta sp.]|uniref:NAD(P)-dependent oxidoreductase n=1 Tax=uncultured Sphaerochaeta sp. TaxID=886478 RepID=UPI002A0A8796|nr:NAD(P)-dependent oxidoreductase [uncultured Sphaerochaeta sp.]
MKIFAYSVRPDEIELFRLFSNTYSVTVDTTDKAPSLATADLSAGYEAISIITTPIDRPLLEQFKALGVHYVSTRTVGFEHIDGKAAEELGIAYGNVSYSPYSVAEYTVMFMLMALRKTKTILAKNAMQDYSLAGTTGRQLHNQTVGIIGTGKIGRTVIKILQGFGCKILATDPYPDSVLANDIHYVSLAELLAASDVITLHVPASTDDSYLLGKAEFAAMKEGMVVVNTARGSLIDQEALMDAIEVGKVGAAALDVIQQEKALYYNDLRYNPLSARTLAILRSYPNVIVTSHTAFHTDQAISDMVENSIKACIEHCSTEK